jgi:hemoglobin
MTTEGGDAYSVTMLDHIGGRERLKAFVEHFHHAVMADDLLSEMFARGSSTHSAHLLAFFEEVMGGRKAYTERHNGVEGLFDAHAGLAITDAQRRRFVALMLKAADEAQLPNDERFRSALAARIEAGSMFSMTLSQPGAERLWPWPPVGTYDW